MQHQNGMVGDNGLNGNSDCPFCHRESIPCVLDETPHFLLATDHAPLVEGHLLIIPKHHYACYGEVPATLDEELQMEKQKVRHFFDEYYAPAVFWEHGIFRQTVFHAHLHCFPFGVTDYDLSSDLHGQHVFSQDDIRAWYASRGQYFYLEDANIALLFAPEMDRYIRVLKDILWRGMSEDTGQTHWSGPQERYEAGGPLIAATAQKWQAFCRARQQERVTEGC